MIKVGINGFGRIGRFVFRAHSLGGRGTADVAKTHKKQSEFLLHKISVTSLCKDKENLHK